MVGVDPASNGLARARRPVYVNMVYFMEMFT